MIRSQKLALALAALGLAAAAVTATASETINYSYDARGRLVQVNRTGTVNNNVVTNYTIDKADNRTNKTTTGSTSASLMPVGSGQPIRQAR